MKKMSLKERIANGECVSPLTTERCPVCVDVCEASRWKMEVKKTIKQALKDKP